MKRENAINWLNFAKEDLISSEVLFNEGLLNTAAYHLQQAVEKSLKAILILKGRNPPKTHDINRLFREVSKYYPIPDDIKRAVDLTDYAFTTRYPDDYVPISKDEYEEAYEIALKVYEWAKGIIEGSALE